MSQSKGGEAVSNRRQICHRQVHCAVIGAFIAEVSTRGSFAGAANVVVSDFGFAADRERTGPGYAVLTRCKVDVISKNTDRIRGATGPNLTCLQ